MTEENADRITSMDMDTNVGLIQSIFAGTDTLITRRIQNKMHPSICFTIMYTDGMVNSKLINEDIIRPLLEFDFKDKKNSLADIVAEQVTLSDSVEKTAEIESIIQAIIYGDTVLFLNGCSEVLLLNTKGWTVRGIAEPESERVLKGPREGFNESLMVNLSLLRRRIRTPDLKMKFKTFGTRTKTKACICYIEGVVNKNVLAELETRIEQFAIDGVLDVNYISEFITDTPYTPIRTIGSTERPDIVAAKLLEGRVALLLDGTPVALTVPHLFIEHFQSDEDYYLNYFFASVGRILRVLAFLISTSVPAMYIALTTFHQEMLPTPLLISISMSRQGVPFPTLVEAILMLAVFEMLRESGARMPGMIGQALSIVGALVIGQAAVEAKIVSAPMIIIVALTGITGLMIPHIKGAIILIRLLLLILAAMAGLYGYLFGMVAFLLHINSLQSFGVSIMNNARSSGFQDSKDILVRSPWWYMKKRPKGISPNSTRLVKNGDKPEG